MPRAHLFNPENDIMLQWPANVTAATTHTLTPAVDAFRRCGAMLPLWWAEGGDTVIVPESALPECRIWLAEMQRMFPPLAGVHVATHCATPSQGAPWGWSGDSARLLSAAGAITPPIGQLERMRQLSHRRTSIAVMDHLRKAIPAYPFPPAAAEIKSVEELEVSDLCRDAFFLKSPWSSSGRGVARFEKLTPQTAARATGIIRRQGSVMAERALDGIQDFAMLYRIEHGKATWMGYSLFFNSHGTSYGGNLMTDDDSIEQRLTDIGADHAILGRIKVELGNALTDIIGSDYTGWLGVDMLVARGGIIAPCIEVNLRMTMGVVAHILTERLLPKGVNAIFSVAPSDHTTKIKAPAVIADGRLIEGTLRLVPPGDFDFSVTVC